MEITRLNIASGEPEPTDSELGLQAAVLASVASVALSFIARFAFGAPLVPELLAQFGFAVAPIWIVELAVGMLGPVAKHLGFLACTVLYFLSLIGSALGLLKVSRRRRDRLSPGMAAALTALVFLITGLAILPLLGAGVFGSRLQQGIAQTTLWLLIADSVYGVALYFCVRFYFGKERAESTSRLLSRRRLIRGTAYAVVLVGVYDISRQLLGWWISWDSGRVKGGDGTFPNIDHLALPITPTPDFYVVSKNAFDPLVEGGSWRLEVGGLVDNPLSLSYAELKALPAIEQYATLCCISNEVGGDLIGNATWRGVRLKDVLAAAGLKPGVVDILLRASDDYTDSIPLDRALGDGTLLVYEMNGQPLTSEHGFPVRLLVPGIYGMKNVKWIKRVEAIDFDFKGYWQRRGWDDRAEYKTMSRIDAPDSRVKGATTIAGIAFAGDRGISKVQISTDGGKTWEEAEVSAALGPYTWVLWQKRWMPTGAGKQRVLVRATDGLGVIQTSRYSPPEPAGSSGYHGKTINVESI